MLTINDRIVELIDTFGIKKIQFAEKLGISTAYVSQLCSGARTPSDRTIADICREFHVRREWLEHGEGPMKFPDRQGDYMEYINELTADDPSPFAALIREALIAYAEADPRDRPALDRFAERFLKP